MHRSNMLFIENSSVFDIAVHTGSILSKTLDINSFQLSMERENLHFIGSVFITHELTGAEYLQEPQPPRLEIGTNTRTDEEFLSLLHYVLTICQKANLKLNANECFFWKRKCSGAEKLSQNPVFDTISSEFKLCLISSLQRLDLNCSNSYVQQTGREASNRDMLP
uniref:AlNc14C260G9791 protein n=1 Tax=Albugo laibachii Nc14 TaxID=890382 RepID=F0WTW7_9STRA|nr:AlNc14C260G9791 [Albugo laibachii Nc14]|eukprot:CCA24811.1 AlNc14C260G9791 [Albugo laibachii Nc14]